MNLLPEIHSQLERAARRSRGLSLLIVMLLMFGVGTAVYAIVNRQIGDPGLEGARLANLVTDLNLTQTIDNVTVALEWGYIDAHRVAFGYSITAPEGQEGTTYAPDITLSDAANSFGQSGDGGGGGGGDDMGRESQYTLSFGVEFAPNPPETLNLRFEMSATPINVAAQGGGFGFGGGGGGGGGGGSSSGEATPEFQLVPGVRLQSGLMTEDTIGPFVFEFTLPYYAAVELTPVQTVESNDLPITLEWLSVAPSLTLAKICFALPDGRDWMPVVALQAGDITAPMTGYGLMSMPSPDDAERCAMYMFYVPYAYTPTPFTFTVSELRTSASYTPERAEQFRQLLADQGVEVEIRTANGEGFDYEVINQPDGDVGLLIQQAMDSAFNDHYTGEWTFTVDIPGMEE